MIQFPRPHVGGQFWVEALQRLCSIGGLPSNKTDGRRVTGCQFFLYGSSSVVDCLYTNITTKIELYDFYRHTVCQCNTGYKPSLIMVMISRGTFITRGGHIVSRSDVYRPS